MTTAGAAAPYQHLIALRAQARKIFDPAARADSRAGGLAGKRRGAGLDVRDLRPYAEGDDLRHIDPAATARTGRPHIRAYHEEQDRAALLVADFRAPMLWGTRRRLRSVAAAEALALVGWRIVEAGGKVGLLALRDDDSDFLPPRQRVGAMMRIAAGLDQAHQAAFQAGQAAIAPLDALLARAGRLSLPGSSLILATGLDAPGPDFDAVAGALARRRRLIVLLTLDAVERDPPRGVFPCLREGSMAWGRFKGEGPDQRIARLERLGAEVILVDAGAEAIGLERRP